MSTTTAHRIQLAKVVGLEISPARVRRFIDKRGINREVEDEISLDRDALLSIEKEGTESVPPAPTRPHADGDAEVDPAEIARYEAEKAAWAEKEKAWKDYKSSRYQTLSTVYSLCKDLTRIGTLLEKQSNTDDSKKKFTEKNATELATVTKRVSENKEFTTYVGKTNLTNLETVNSLVENLTTERFPDVKHFFHKDACSASRVRFNERATVALATVMEAIVVELAEHSMDHVIEIKKKIIQPDHCVSNGVENCSLYPLIAPLRAFQAIRSKQDRFAEYQADVKHQQEEANRKARQDAKRKKKNYKKPELNLPTFAQKEVDAGYAKFNDDIKKGKDGEDDETAQVAQWYGIDIPADGEEVVDNTDFNFYVTNVFKKVRDGDSDNTWSELRFSTPIKNFFSDLLIQFIGRMLPMIRLLISFNKNSIKTVDDKVVMRVVEMWLTDSHQDTTTGEYTLSEDHRVLFSTVADKLALLEAHKHHNPTGTEETTATTTSTPEADSAPETTTETTSETTTAEATAPAATTKTTSRRKRKTAQ